MFVKSHDGKQLRKQVVVPPDLGLLLVLGVLLVLPEPVVVWVDDEPLVRLSEPSRPCGLSHHALELKHAVERLCRYAHVSFLEQVGGGVQHRVRCSSVHDRWQLCRQAELVANLLRPSNLGCVVEVEGLDGPVGEGEVGLNLLVERCLLLADAILTSLADRWEHLARHPTLELLRSLLLASEDEGINATLSNKRCANYLYGIRSVCSFSCNYPHVAFYDVGVINMQSYGITAIRVAKSMGDILGTKQQFTTCIIGNDANLPKLRAAKNLNCVHLLNIFEHKKTALRVVQGFQQTPVVVSYPPTRRSNSI